MPTSGRPPLTPLHLLTTGCHVGDPGGMRREPEEETGPPYFGLPEHSALTMEGRIERTAGAADHVVRMRSGRERPIRSSAWAVGLWLIAGGFGLLMVILVVLYAIG